MPRDERLLVVLWWLLQLIRLPPLTVWIARGVVAARLDRARSGWSPSYWLVLLASIKLSKK